MNQGIDRLLDIAIKMSADSIFQEEMIKAIKLRNAWWYRFSFCVPIWLPVFGPLYWVVVARERRKREITEITS